MRRLPQRGDGHNCALAGGDGATLSAGPGSVVIGGRGSRLIGGVGSLVLGGEGSVLAGGQGSTLSIKYWDGKKWRRRQAQVKDRGGNGDLEPDTLYRLDSNGRFVKVEK